MTQRCILRLLTHPCLLFRMEATVSRQREAAKDAILVARASALRSQASIADLDVGADRENQRAAEQRAIALVRTAIKRKIGDRRFRAVVNDRREAKLRLLTDNVSRAIGVALASIDQQPAHATEVARSVHAHPNAVYCRHR